jgi:hypothetical protein
MLGTLFCTNLQPIALEKEITLLTRKFVTAGIVVFGLLVALVSPSFSASADETSDLKKMIAIQAAQVEELKMQLARQAAQIEELKKAQG